MIAQMNKNKIYESEHNCSKLLQKSVKMTQNRLKFEKSGKNKKPAIAGFLKYDKHI